MLQIQAHQGISLHDKVPEVRLPDGDIRQFPVSAVPGKEQFKTRSLFRRVVSGGEEEFVEIRPLFVLRFDRAVLCRQHRRHKTASF